MDGGRDLLGLTLENGNWKPPQRQRLPVQMQFATFNQRADELLLTSVQVSGPFPRTLLRVDTRNPQNLAFTVVNLKGTEVSCQCPERPYGFHR